MRRRRGPDLGDADIRLMLQLALRANRVVAHGMPAGVGGAGPHPALSQRERGLLIRTAQVWQAPLAASPRT